ncbi:MAG: hypothetical protein ACW97A_10885 [Candidatus Thorarchaeota archaeon]|jgi:hypothetical protein
MSDERNIDFVITKAAVGADGVKRWAATVSKFAIDEHGDEVTTEFFEHSIDQIGKGNHPMPALVVSHLDDSRPEAILEPVPTVFRAGTTTDMYIEGDKPKAKGTFEDTPLGNALFEAVKGDLKANLPHEERVRISMAWRPEKNGVEKADVDHNRHLRGVIRHFSSTRVPVVKETDIMTYKSESDRRLSKYEDAVSIVGEELADELLTALSELPQTKSEDNELVEKANDKVDEDEEMEEEEDKKKKKRNSKDMEEDVEQENDTEEEEEEEEEEEKADTKNFDMGKCLRVKLDEGMDKKKALAICLDMSRKGGEKSSPKKSEAGDVVEKGKGKTAGEFDIDACVQKLRDGGTNFSLAIQLCEARAKKASRTELHERLTRGKRKAALEEKADMDLDDVVDLLVSDSEVQVVTKAEEETQEVENTDEGYTLSDVENALLDVIEQLGTPESVSEVSVETEDVNDSEDEVMDEVVTEEQKDVNEVVETKSTASESGMESLDSYFNLLKSALVDDSMDQTEKALVFNHSVEEIGRVAEEMIKEETPASPQDMASMIKAALDEAMGPMVTQQSLLIQRVNELEVEKAELVQGAARPEPKQLRHHSPYKEKADATDEGGALTARQMAISTRYSNEVYY